MNAANGGRGESQLLIKKMKNKNGITSEVRVKRAEVQCPSKRGPYGSRLSVWPGESSVSLRLSSSFCKMGIIMAGFNPAHRKCTIHDQQYTTLFQAPEFSADWKCVHI